MKKTICVLAIVLLVASVAFGAEKAKAKKAGITKDNVGQLKGTWQGTMSFGEFGVSGAVANSNVLLEIPGDSVPVKAKLTISDVPIAVAGQLGVMEGKHVVDGEGQLTSQGTVMFVGPTKNFLELSLAGEKGLRGWYYFNGLKGDLNLKKK
jgi:hypothetical protein